MSPDNRRALLLEAHRNFTTLAHLYGDLWSKATKPQQISALEEFYTMSFTGASIANSELGMHDVAAKNFAKHLKRWQAISRQQVNELLIDKKPARLLSAPPDELTTLELINLLDFSADAEKGIGWLDELRARSSSKLPDFGKIWGQYDQQMMQTAKRWVPRSEVLTAHQAHLEFLARRHISVGRFSKELLAAGAGKPICVMPIPTQIKA
jgi:hypothetical protein